MDNAGRGKKSTEDGNPHEYRLFWIFLHNRREWKVANCITPHLHQKRARRTTEATIYMVDHLFVLAVPLTRRQREGQ